VRYIPGQDQYNRWAVQDTLWPDFYLMTPRYVDEVSAQTFCDILNAGCSFAEKERLWVAHRAVRQFAPLLEVSKS
jgi:hypothetical protein